nr:uncharacterized protein LOC105348378 isoform X2 [Crassostrea gigas]
MFRILAFAFVTQAQFVNNETIASSSSTYHNHFAPKTVDGSFDQNLSNCLHTDVNRQYRDAWLRIDLRKVYSVKSVKFWYRGDRGSPYKNTVRLRGYSLRVSNDTSVPPPESSCYNDTGIVTLPTIVEEDCERTARYIWIHQTNKGNKDEWCPMLEICEVQVFGCDVGYYGENCSDRCYHCKNNATCGIQHGDCDDSGCVNPGKQPPRCKGCIIGMYGINCENNCSLYCAYGDCDRTTGTCLDGCKSGFIGRFCNKTCSVGKYGSQCSESCGHC